MIKRGGIIAAAQRYWRRDSWNNEYFDAAGYADFVLASRDAEIDQLRAELAKALAACKAKDEALRAANHSCIEDWPLLREALSIQPDDSALKAWLGEPVAWEFTDAFGTHYTDDQRDWMDTPGIESVTRLYSPKGLK